MEQYDDVCLKVTYFFIIMKLLDNNTFWYFASDVPIHILQALATFQTALQYNPQSSEVSRKIKRVSQLSRDKKRAQEVENKRLNIDMEKNLDKLKSEMVSVVRKHIFHIFMYFYLFSVIPQLG